jgi:hypothetical protein
MDRASMVTPGRKPMGWTLTTTEMTQAQAEQACSMIESTFPDVYANTSNPAGWFRLSFDRWTTEMLRDALIALKKQGGDVDGLLEDVEDWLANQAEPYDAADEEHYQPIN